MSDVNAKTYTIESFPSKIRMQYLASYILPVIAYCIVLVFSNEFSFSDFARVLLSPVSIICILLIDIALPMVIYNIFQSKICKYDGTDEGNLQVNHTAATFEKAHMAYILVNGVIFVAAPYMTATSLDINVDVLTLIFLSAGSVFLFGFFPLIYFLHDFEELLIPVTFKRSQITLSLVTRNVIITGLAVLAVLSYTIAPIFVLANEHLQAHVLFIRKILPMTIAAMAMGLVDTAILMVGVRKRLRPITDFGHKLAAREYTMDTLPVMSRDETGLLKQMVNAFYTANRDLLVAMADSIGVSRAAADVLSARMGEASTSITQITANIESVKTRVVNQSAGVEEAEATVDTIVEKLNTLATSVEQQSEDISSSSNSVEEMVANIKSVSDILMKNTVAVNQLTSASDTGRAKVEQAVEQAKSILEESAGLLEASDIIQNIAEQTNLLAMNAAIEAAHAGEAGKGFAVVSDEIRKLAEQSNTQGKTISVQLEKLQQSIANITTATKEVQDQFSIIFSLAETVKNQETVVEHAMQEQNAGSAQVLDAIKSMKQSTQQLQSGSMELQSGSKEIAAEMKSLAQVTEEINGAMSEIANGIESIVKSMEEVNASSEANHENLNVLSNEISRFNVKKANKE